ncbi:hypothetical protein APR04_000099 [Promicromonospora umidemergens]|uniref:Zinc metallochaperone AztD n=1 Tax=Promicromonospora umidemergens TaxID=629679 RepID=A0ABP8X6A5_9MICO|nr:zinc metallochaperone AztD [Promicromonospora umidemergens]MCP2281210.1 hypothetical protein [Promicromonospora umidemergens]
MRNHTTRTAAGLGAALSLLLLSACAADDGTASGAASESASAGTDEQEAPEATEAQARTPRVAVTYQGGVLVLDAMSLEPVGDIELEGFNRLSPAGDERHLMVSTAGEFRALDLGSWAEAHGDHAHYWTAEPTLTDVAYEAAKPGHVVVHEGRTALFDDGTGLVRVVDSEHVADADAAAREHTTPSAHHGVAVELTDDTLVVSEGTEEGANGIRVLDGDGKEIAASDECPGVHGEAVAADEAVLIGCQDGALLYTDGKITKVDAPDSYGRIGNQAGTEASPVVLGDYKTDKDAELERPTQVSLIDTRDGKLELVELPSSYTFRSLARGDDGEALVLGTDGQVHVIDPEKAEVTKSIPVIDEWEEPVEWQEPRPAILALDGSVYVTDPATDSIHAVDVESGEVWKTAELGVTPNELNGVTGGEAHAHEEHEEHEDHEDHEDH